MCELFDSSKKEDNNYTFKVNTSKLATLLDNMGSIKLDNATLEATIRNNKITHLALNFIGTQTVENASADIDVSLKLNIKNLKKINFPNDLEEYKNANCRRLIFLQSFSIFLLFLLSLFVFA